jgi:hypothetical protein
MQQTVMAKPLASDEGGLRIATLLPSHHSREENGGKQRSDEWPVQDGILFLLNSGIPWAMQTWTINCSSGMTRRPRRDLLSLCVWHKLQVVILSQLRGADTID